MANVKISALSSGTPLETDYIPYVDGVANATKKALKSELNGADGADGATGNGIANITLINTVGLVKTYRITYTDATTFDYDVTDGTNGTNGTNGTDGNDGNGIVSITLISTVGLIKTYRILFTDTTTFDYTVTDGEDGTGSGDVMAPATNTDSYIPQWDGANSKTLKDGLAVPAGGLAGLTALGAKEDTTNKETSALDTSTTKYPCNNVVKSAVDGKMANPMTTAGDTIYGGASGVPTRLGVGTAGQVLTVNSGATAPEWADASGGGSSLWTLMPGTPTRVSNTQLTITDTSNTLKLDLLLSRLTCIKWTESSTLKQAMIVSATYATNTVTINIIGDVLTSIDASSMKYFAQKASFYKFAYAGSVGAVSTNVANKIKCEVAGKIYGLDFWAGTAGSGTTTIDLNKNGSTITTTKASIITTGDSVSGVTADNGTVTAVGDYLTLDIDAIAATTVIIDAYVNVYYLPLYNSYLS